MSTSAPDEARAAPERSVDVALGEHAYRIAIGPGLLRRADGWLPLLRGRHVLVISDSNVAPLYAAPVLDALRAHAAALHVLPAGEPHKTLDETARVFDALARLGASRDATVVALGGGVVGDLAGFAAACWMRGIAFVQMPTTLLAMVDSAVGGKTAVNVAVGKNLVGAFHQPRGVVADTDTLATLPARELVAGLAEVLKYGAIMDAPMFARIAAQADALRARDAVALADAIEASCRHKAAIVARDERETGERALLNFGHTFAHALETATGYDTLLHGEAVAIGMLLAARLSARVGLAPAADADALADALRALALPLAPPPGLGADALLALMRLDKKAASGRVRLVLWHGIGAARLVDDVPDAAILATLRESRRGVTYNHAMRIFMQLKPGANESPKYVHLILQQDLLGGWTLIRESGQQGGRATLKRDVYLERDAAEAALLAQRDQQLKRGFQVMFVQGTDAPGGGYEA